MTEAEVREWLTDRRGAALGVSGPFEGPPANSPLLLLEPLADAGELDRSDSLSILHDPRLDDPELSSDELESAIEIVLQSSELRHGDRVSAARHLWRSVLQRTETSQAVPNLVSAFADTWLKTALPSGDGMVAAIEKPTISDLLAWLDGVERFLTSRPDRNPTLSESKHLRLRDFARGDGAVCAWRALRGSS